MEAIKIKNMERAAIDGEEHIFRTHMYSDCSNALFKFLDSRDERWSADVVGAYKEICSPLIIHPAIVSPIFNQRTAEDLAPVIHGVDVYYRAPALSRIKSPAKRVVATLCENDLSQTETPGIGLVLFVETLHGIITGKNPKDLLMSAEEVKIGIPKFATENEKFHSVDIVNAVIFGIVTSQFNSSCEFKFTSSSPTATLQFVPYLITKALSIQDTFATRAKMKS